MFEPIILKNIDHPDSDKLDFYLEGGGYKGLTRALKMDPSDVRLVVQESGLRGRGGAAFPTGIKWNFIPFSLPGPRYLVCNADEGEPGTFKDRYIMENNPQLLIEGMAIAAYGLRVEQGFIFLRCEYARSLEVLKRAIGQAEEKGFLGERILGSEFSFTIRVLVGAGGYICGEETSLLNTIEGRRPNPRSKPPFPQVKGLWGRPTIVNNVETLSYVAPIVLNGSEWYQSLGVDHRAGTKLFSLSGRVKRPGCYELPMGTNLRDIINECGGGMMDGYQVKGVFPGGSSVPILSADELDIAMDNDDLRKLNCRLGSGGIIVIDDSFCMVRAALNLSKFYMRESCGFCVPCREGLPWLVNLLQTIEDGNGKTGDIELIRDICGGILGKSFCPMAWGAIDPIQSIVEKFTGEFEDHITRGGCGFRTND
jgi:NADH-quinone oxidoreductase subunit F